MNAAGWRGCASPRQRCRRYCPTRRSSRSTAPRVVTWCRRTGVSASTYLMPLSYAAVLGGVVTVIGTSTNLVVSDLLVAGGGEPLGVFEITSVGLPVAAVGVLVLIVTGPRLLGKRGGREEGRAPAEHTYTLAMRVLPDGAIAGRTVHDAGLRSLHGVFLAGVERAGGLVPARPETVLGPGDLCYFAGDVDDVVDLLETPGLQSAEQPHVAGAGDRPDAGLYEVVISEQSELAGSTMRDVGFRARYDAAVLAIKRHDDEIPGKLGTVVLRAGDVLLVLATPEFERQWRGHRDFSVIASRATSPPVRSARGWVVLTAIFGMIALTVTNLLDLMEASLLAAVALIVLRVISVNEARRAVNLNVVLTIALSVSLGTAVSVSGLAGEVATVLGRLGDPFGDIGSVVAILAATMLLTELLSNNAAAAVMLPVATALSLENGLDPAFDGNRGADRCVVFVPVADRLPDELDGVQPRRLPVRRLHTAGCPAHAGDVDPDTDRRALDHRYLNGPIPTTTPVKVQPAPGAGTPRRRVAANAAKPANRIVAPISTRLLGSLPAVARSQSSAGLSSLDWPGTHGVVVGDVFGAGGIRGLAQAESSGGYCTVAIAGGAPSTITSIVSPSRRRSSVGSGSHDSPSSARRQPGQSVALPASSMEAPGQMICPVKLSTVSVPTSFPSADRMTRVADWSTGVKPTGTIV